jgi:hypothetical protein
MHMRHFLAVGVAVIGAAAMPSYSAEATLKGAFALLSIAAKVTAELAVRPLTRELLIAFTDKPTGQPIAHFGEELTQELHLLATDSGFSSLVHEHVTLNWDIAVEMLRKAPGMIHSDGNTVTVEPGMTKVLT